MLRLDAPAEKPWRGLLVAVRRNLVFQQLPDLNARSFQSLGVEIHFGSKALRVYACYRGLERQAPRLEMCLHLHHRATLAPRLLTPRV